MAEQNRNTDSHESPTSEVRCIVLEEAGLRRFDSERMAQHNYLLGRAGDVLSDAYDVAACTAVLGRLIRASQIGRSAGCKDVLDLSDEDNLMRGLISMNEMLYSRLCGTAEAFENRMTEIEREAAQ